MNQATFHCNHMPKRIRLTIDGALGEIYRIELCLQCHIAQSKKFVIKEEILQE